MKYQAVSSFLSFSPFFFWLIRACTDDINSEQGRKLKIAAAAATFPLHLALLLWDLKNAKLQVQFFDLRGTVLQDNCLFHLSICLAPTVFHKEQL